MPVKIRIEGIFPDPKTYPDKKLERAIASLKDYLIDDAGDMLQKDMESTVEGWSHQPTFPVVYNEPYGTQMQIFVTVAGKYSTNWKRISGGTESRVIRARPGKMMVFPAEYAPHTQPGGKWGGPGNRYGDIVRTSVVGTRKLHRIEPREFSKVIVDRRENKIRRDVNLVIKKALG